MRGTIMDKAEGQRQHFEPANRILTDGNVPGNRNARLVREDALRMLGLLCLIAIQIGIMVALPPRPVLGVIILGILLVLGVSFLADFLAAVRRRPQPHSTTNGSTAGPTEPVRTCSAAPSSQHSSGVTGQPSIDDPKIIWREPHD